MSQARTCFTYRRLDALFTRTDREQFLQRLRLNFFGIQLLYRFHILVLRQAKRFDLLLAHGGKCSVSMSRLPVSLSSLRADSLRFFSLILRSPPITG